ncbi:SDR family NAD(P)-dependent oxidoreductase [Streptomyces sp. NBC_00986]|uniref:SDR family NAD(P)-dependent oxidoreductase n=1 Tax=Streptomyces sp. NBC_00986 TaxID=2903702 RepID=UPI00386AD599|nr:SDR family NAD(P)-dependent oxidoreductase [Streptomyces sp. NBC_00986]
MPASPQPKIAVVLGVGPGLGMSIAHRFGREGYAVALVSRSDTRHADYVASLTAAGVEAASYVADVRDTKQLGSVLDTVAERYGRVDLVYYGPGAVDEGAWPKPITEAESADVREAMSWMYPAVDVVGRVLPGMVERGGGALLFAGGLSAVVPMPGLGALAVSSAAQRNYALTLNAALADKGVYVGNLVIGGLIERGDIHHLVTSNPEQFGNVGDRTLDPDEIADGAWELVARRDRAEETFSVLG